MARNLFATAIFSAALAVGGLGGAAAHHGDVSEHSTTKGKNLAEIERKERQITAELNRKQAIQGQQQLAMAQQTQMPQQQMPAAQMPTSEAPAATEDAPGEEDAGPN